MTATVEAPSRVRELPRAAAQKSEQQGTASVLKALNLLDVFVGNGGAMGVTDIARRAGVPVSTAYRLLAYLVEGGFVTKEGTLYRPGDKLFEFGTQVVNTRLQSLRELAAPYLGELYATFGMTARLAILDGSEIVIVDKIVGLRTLPAPTAVGGRVPATCTALGKAMLAFQPVEALKEVLQGPLPRRTPYSVVVPGLLHRQLIETRSTRLAYDREESVLGHVCVATPIRRDGVAVAAISLSGPPRRVGPRHLGPALLRAAGQIERAFAAEQAENGGPSIAPSGKRSLPTA
ncbi:MAG TPA: IclR family transcriptional regulator [Micromonosporaceae bacterium]|nr:IclR family transcriptional regulator [Micromonosporaceae bacterium]